MKKLPLDKRKFILKVIEEQLKQLAASYKLTGAATESWRWDVPAVSLNWKGDDEIHRNIIVLLEAEPPIASATIEVNGWLDEEDPAKGGRLRHWQHARTAPLDLLVEKALRQDLELAYKKVSSWDRSKLKRQKHLSVHSPVLREGE